MSDKATHKTFCITPKHDYEMEAYVTLQIGTKDELIEELRRIVGEDDYTITSAANDWDDDWERYDIEIKGYEIYGAYIWLKQEED